MKNYNLKVRDRAEMLFKETFNEISFELLKKAVGEDTIIDDIEKPSQHIIITDWLADTKDEQEIKELEKKFKQEGGKWQTFEDWLDEIYQSEIDDWWHEQEHYPMWGTIFEAKEDFVSDKIMDDIDGLYDLGIGVIAPTEDTNACLFIAGMGYNFYTAHWTPLFIHWDWINVEKIEREAETFENTNTHKPELIDWSVFTDILVKLSRNNDKTIKRHADGLLKALKL